MYFQVLINYRITYAVSGQLTSWPRQRQLGPGAHYETYLVNKYYTRVKRVLAFSLIHILKLLTIFIRIQFNCYKQLQFHAEIFYVNYCKIG